MMLPHGVLIGLGVVALVGAGTLLHSCEVKEFGKEQFAKGVKHEQDRITRKVERIAKGSEKITRNVGKVLDAKVITIYKRGASIVMRGPGKAACIPAVSASSGGHNNTAGPANATVAGVRDREGVALIGLPLDDTAAFATQCDIWRARNEAWNEWHQQQSELREKDND